MRAFRHIILALAFIAALTQSFGVSVLRAAQIDGSHHTALICASPDKIISDEAAAAARELAILLGQSQSPQQGESEHCEDCIMSAFAVLGAPSSLPVPAATISVKSKPALNPAQFAHKPQGPPLGGRAPPTFI